MRTILVACLAMAACGHGDDGDERIPDEPNDPYPGLWVRPSEFPHDHCGSGSIAGLTTPVDYTQISLRLDEDDDGSLRTFLSGSFDDVESAHLLTDGDLLVRREYTYHRNVDGMRVEMFGIEAVDICGIDDDGTIHGYFARCGDTTRRGCDQFDPIDEGPLRRIDGEDLGSHIELVGEYGGTWPGHRSLDVKVDGDIAYLANSYDGLRIISVADPANPVELGHFNVETDYANDVAVVHANGRVYAVIASDIGRVVDVTDPAHPALVAELDVHPHTVVTEGLIAYFATGFDGQVPAYDLTDPAHPVKLGMWDAMSEEPLYQLGYHDLYVQGGIAYLSAYTGEGLDVVDFTNPAAPTQVKLQLESNGPFGPAYWHCPWTTTVGTQLLAIDGDEASGVGLRIYNGDRTSASFLDPVGAWRLRDDQVSIHNIMAFGNRVYMSHYQDGVRVLDISDPTQPQQVGYYNTWVEGSAPGTYFAGAVGIDVDLARKRIYIADITRGLMILQGDATVFPDIALAPAKR